MLEQTIRMMGAKMFKQTIRMRGASIRQHVMVMSAIWARLQHAYKRKQMMDNM